MSKTGRAFVVKKDFSLIDWNEHNSIPISQDGFSAFERNTCSIVIPQKTIDNFRRQTSKAIHYVKGNPGDSMNVMDHIEPDLFQTFHEPKFEEEKEILYSVNIHKWCKK